MADRSDAARELITAVGDLLVAGDVVGDSPSLETSSLVANA